MRRPVAEISWPRNRNGLSCTGLALASYYVLSQSTSIAKSQQPLGIVNDPTLSGIDAGIISQLTRGRLGKSREAGAGEGGGGGGREGRGRGRGVGDGIVCLVCVGVREGVGGVVLGLGVWCQGGGGGDMDLNASSLRPRRICEI